MQAEPRTLYPYLAGAGFACIWGLSFMFTKGALDHLDPLRLVGFRFVIATAVVSLLAASGAVRVSLRGKDLRPLLLVSCLQPIGYFVFETAGISLTTSSQAGMMIALIPVVVAMLGAMMLKERLSPAQWACIFLSVCGVAVISAARNGSGQASSWLGPVLLLGAVVAAALYNISARRASATFSPFEITYVMMWTGAVAFTGAAFVQQALAGSLADFLRPLGRKEVLGSLAYLGVLASVVGFLLCNYALSRLPASQAAVFGNLVTAVAIAAGVVLRGEPFAGRHLLGAAMILTGVWGTNYFAAAARAARSAACEGAAPGV